MNQDSLSLLAHCPHCRHPYGRKDAKLVDFSKELTTYHLFCPSCQHALLLYVQFSDGGMRCAGVFTDCSFDDAIRFKESSKITIDDVLAAHLALQLDNFMEIR